MTLVDGVVSNSNESNMAHVSHWIYYRYLCRLISSESNIWAIFCRRWNRV